MKLTDKATDFLTQVSAQVIYGAILLEAVLGAQSEPLPGNLALLIGMTISVAVVSIAGAYAESIGEDIEQRTVTPWRTRARMLTGLVFQRSWMLAPLLVPIGFFGLAMMGVVPQTAAYALTRSTLLGVLFFFGFVAGRLSGTSVMSSMLTATAITLLGYAVVQAKVLAKFAATLGH